MVRTRSQKKAVAVGTSTLIASLPEDVLINILEDDAISHEDLVALRQTCVAFVGPTTRILFRRVRISQLSHDRDVFLAICQTPRLASHVRELDWEEVSWFPNYFDRIIKVGLPPVWDGDAATDTVCGKLAPMVADLFWLPVVVPRELPLPEFEEDTAESDYEEIVAQFRDEFCSALRKLKNLHTILSRPMDPNRTLRCPDYPMEVNLFQVHHFDRNATHSNNGLFDFLLPAIDAIEASAAPNVTKLLWEDQPEGSSYVHQPYPAALSAFQRLESLNVSLIPRSPLDGLANLLNAATNVKHLSLSLSFTISKYNQRDIQRTLLRLDQPTQWSNLRSLSLTLMPLVREHLISIVENNAATLRHLYLSECLISLRIATSLATVEGIHLLTFGIHEDPDAGLQYRMKEVDLLEIINNSLEITKYPRNALITTIPMQESLGRPSDSSSDGMSEESLDDDDDDYMTAQTKSGIETSYGLYY